MDIPTLDEIVGHRPTVFLIDTPFSSRLHRDYADRLKVITGMDRSGIETTLLDMLCCHIVSGDPDDTDWDVDYQYTEWLMDGESPLEDDDLADAVHYFTKIHLGIYRPLIINNTEKIRRFGSAEYRYSWKHVDDDHGVALIFEYGE